MKRAFLSGASLTQSYALSLNQNDEVGVLAVADAKWVHSSRSLLSEKPAQYQALNSADYETVKELLYCDIPVSSKGKVGAVVGFQVRHPVIQIYTFDMKKKQALIHYRWRKGELVVIVGRGRSTIIF